MIICNACDGIDFKYDGFNYVCLTCGERKVIGTGRCDSCDGTGQHKRDRLVGDRIETWYSPVAKCRSCNGTGEQRASNN